MGERVVMRGRGKNAGTGVPETSWERGREGSGQGKRANRGGVRGRDNVSTGGSGQV